jgi:hypothetical protein
VWSFELGTVGTVAVMVDRLILIRESCVAINLFRLLLYK